MTAPLLGLAANSHHWLTFEAHETPAWGSAVAWLEQAGFVRSGKPVVGIDEGILPSFVRKGITIAAGWDAWSGHYLLARCDAGDRVLLELAGHVAARDGRDGA